MTTQVKSNTDISKLFTFDDFEGEEQQAFLDEVGTLVFQSALMRYLAEQEEEVGEKFEQFIEKNVEEENFMEVLCAEFPVFENILIEEMKAFQAEIIF